MNRSSKPSIVLILLLSLVLLLGACSNAGNTKENTANKAPTTTNETPKAKATSTKTETASSTPQIIKHLKGELTLETVPQKIVVLDQQFADHLLVLGVKPTASVTQEGNEFVQYLSDQLTDTKPIGTQGAINLEAILETSPDLIISIETYEDIYDNLSKIAPTLVLNRNDDWRETIKTMGQIVGEEQEAVQVISDYDAKTAELKGKLTAKLGDQTVGVLRPMEKELRMYTKAHRMTTILYDELGLNPPTLADVDTDTSMALSMELLPEFTPDHMFLFTSDTTKEQTSQLEETSIYQSLGAVTSKQVYPIDTMWITGYGPIGNSLFIDEIVNTLLK